MNILLKVVLTLLMMTLPTLLLFEFITGGVLVEKGSVADRSPEAAIAIVLVFWYLAGFLTYKVIWRDR